MTTTPGADEAIWRGAQEPAPSECHSPGVAVSRRLNPGLAFWLVCDRGFAVGLMTHHRERIGHVIWMAEPFFDNEPTGEDVKAISRWRWPVLFPLGAALHRKTVTRIGQVEVPAALRPPPTFRSKMGSAGWVAVDVVEDKRLGPTTDRSLPIYSVVNDTRLKEMLITDWRPADTW